MGVSLATSDEVERAVGRELGPSPWVTLDQARIDAFAEVTGDRQWIHVDPARAALGPYGTTVAHGYLTLSLTPMLLDQVSQLRRHWVSVNYGLNRVRFLAPVRAGDRVRMRAEILSAEPRPGAGLLLTFSITYELEGGERPALVAETMSLLRPRPQGS